jgi:hypothetical protein
MSGGYFNYGGISLAADEVEEVLRLAESGRPNEYGSTDPYPEPILECFRECVSALRRADRMMRCIDLLYSGDYSPEYFMKNWPKPDKNKEKTNE